MRTKVWYYVGNNGDGSVSVYFCETEKLAKLLDELESEDGEGWGEICASYVMIESDSPIVVLEILTASELVKEIDDDYDKDDVGYPHKKHKALRLLEQQALKGGE